MAEHLSHPLGRLALHDLVRPLDVQTFVRQHVAGKHHHLSLPNPDLLTTIESVFNFLDVERLTRLCDTVTVFQGGLRPTMPGQMAIDFYNRGYSLYISNLHKVVPGVRALMMGVAQELGVHSRFTTIEFFAGKRGSVSPLHYDHDTNFQLLLAGRKIWRVQRNTHVQNPLLPNHWLDDPREELYASSLPLPSSIQDLPELTEVEASAGTCLFFPVGYWHQVEMLEDSVAINLVLRPPALVDTFSAALRRILMADISFRETMLTPRDVDGSMLQGDWRANISELLDKYKVAATTLTLEDVELAIEPCMMRWTPAAFDRRLDTTCSGCVLRSTALGSIELADELGPVVDRLLLCRGTFGLGEIKSAAIKVSTRTLLQLLQTLQAVGYLSPVPPNHSGQAQ